MIFLQCASVRMLGAVLTSSVVMLCVMPLFIRLMQRYYVQGQPIRDDGPARHRVTKRGVPPMGGVVVLLALVLSAVLWADLGEASVWVLLAAFGAFAALGLADDYAKVHRGSVKGLSVKQKLGFQGLLAGALMCLVLWFRCDALQTSLFVPFFTKCLIPLGIAVYVVGGVFVVVGTANAVNMTDGLDGLAAGCALVACAVLGSMAYISTQAGAVPSVSGGAEIMVMCGALMGALLGFLWFNAHPAQIFMGDTGSLALGAFLAMASILLKQELALALFGGVFVAEALSVMIQVAVFKRTKKRVFLMAPLHHHFELLGWSETKVVVRFWAVAVLLGVGSLFFLTIS